MKIFLKILLGITGLVIACVIIFIGLLGYIPGLSAVLGADKPRDLGIRYTEADKTSGRNKSQMEYGTLPGDTTPAESIRRTGSREIKAEFSSAEITALMNDRPWKYWPYKNVQIKFNTDGSAEISGQIIKERLSGYGMAIGAPQAAVDFAQKYLPENPVFYLKMKASLTENKVGVFDPQVFRIGRMNLPVGMFLSLHLPEAVPAVYAENEMQTELDKVQNKREYIIGYINQRLGSLGNFYARSAFFGENKLVFDGILAEKEDYAQ